MNYKAIINFDAYKPPELVPVAQVIHDKMTEHEDVFTDPPLSMPDLQILISHYRETLAARASRATLDVLACNLARVELKQALGRLGHYVNGIAKGSQAIVEKSGFPSYDTSRSADRSPPAAPLDLRLRQGLLSGSMVARYKPERRQSTNEVQTTTGDPNNEADWHTKGFYRSGRAEMDGFTPGVLVWVRVRTLGLRGVMGPWSDPAQIRVV